MAETQNTLTDEILVLAETLGDIKARFERVETEFATQAKPLEAALSALSAAMTGIKTLQHHVLDNSLSALSIKVEEQRKAIDDQIGVIVGELKGADAANSERISAQTAELRQQLAEISGSVRELASQFDAQLKRVELEAKEEAKKFALVPGPQGPAGASINPRGNWIDGVAYNRLDVVSLLGTSYISAVDNNTSKPAKASDKWTILARAGTGGGGAGDFGSLAGVAQINQGGTGQTTAIAGARALLDGISTTQGSVLYRGASGWTSLPPGSSGFVLQSQGAGADPIFTAVSGSGLGDVSGPASATDNAIVRFDGTSGKNVQNSAVTIDDSGNLSANTLQTSGSGVSTIYNILSAGSGTMASDEAAIRVHNVSDDKPAIGFYRGGTLRSVIRLNTDNDFRLLSSDFATPSALTTGDLTVSGTGNLTNSANTGTLLVSATDGSYSSSLIYGNTTRAASGSFNLLALQASGVSQFTVGGNGNVTATGNLTVSGTGPSTFAGSAKVGASGTADSRLHVYESATAGTGNGLTIEQAGAGDAVTQYLLTGVQRWSTGIDNSDLDAFVISAGALGTNNVLRATAAGGTAILGTTTNDNAATGYVGEYVNSTVAAGSAVSLTTDTTTNVTSISLTAGDWTIEQLVVSFAHATSTTVSYQTAAASSTSATLPTEGDFATRSFPAGTVIGTSPAGTVVFPGQRFSLSSTTTIYLVARAGFGVSTMTAYGKISARRVR